MHTTSSALILLSLATLAPAQPATPWWRTAVCPMVGPQRPDSGPAGVTPDQMLRDFRPEVAEWSCLPQMKSHPLCPRAIRGGIEYQVFPQGAAYGFRLWRDKYGTEYAPTEDNGVDVPSSGQSVSLRYGTEGKETMHFVCHNSPRWHEFHRDSVVRAAADPTVSLVRQDNTGCPTGLIYDNGGWCKWCMGGFSARLRGLPAERLRALGIAEADGVAPRAVLQATLARTPAERLEDPLVREYVRFMLRSNLDLWRDEVAAAHAARPDIPICGNAGDVTIQPYQLVLLSDAADLIFLENLNRSFTTNPNGLWYALCLAGGRHSRPAWIWDFSYPAFMEQVAGSQLFVAECYVNGATPYYLMNNMLWSDQKGFYLAPLGTRPYPALARYAQFAHAHADLLTNSYAADTPVAVLYSVPSFAPRYMACAKLGENVPGTVAAKQHFTGWARALEAAHVPYNVEILGDEELWPDRNLDERLAHYGLLICPGIEALSDAQLNSLRRFQAGGGRLLISGLFANRDETFARRPVPAASDLERAAIRVGAEPEQTVAVATSKETHGASQEVPVNQADAKPLVVRGWSRAQDVSGPDDHHYSLWVDVIYNDGTALWEQVAPFRTGTHDWELAELTITPAKPVKSLTILPLLRNHSGQAWFDDLFVGEAGSEANLLQDPGFEGAGTQQLPAWAPFTGPQPAGAAYVPDRTLAHSGRGSISCGAAGAPGAARARAVLRQALDRALTDFPHLQTDAPPTVQLRAYRHGNRVVLQMLNLDLDAAKDEVRPAGPFMVSLPLSPGAQLTGEVTLYAADGDQSAQALPAAVRDGIVEVRVPGLVVWSVVTFTEG